MWKGETFILQVGEGRGVGPEAGRDLGGFGHLDRKVGRQIPAAQV